MHVVSHVLTCSHGNLDCHRAGLHIDYRITTPRLLSIHCLSLDFFYIGLHVTAALFISNQNTITAGRNNHVLAAHAKDRDIQFVHHIGIFAGFIQNSLALGLVCHDLSHHVPCANILPVTAIP